VLGELIADSVSLRPGATTLPHDLAPLAGEAGAEGPADVDHLASPTSAGDRR
jgi:hypothetical protein